MKTFTELNVCENIVNALAAQKIIIPTEVQQAVIPTALENRDVIAESRTGSDTPKTPAWAGSRPASSVSTKPGYS